MKALALSVVVAVGLTAAAGDLWARGGSGGGGSRGGSSQGTMRSSGGGGGSCQMGGGGQGKQRKTRKQHRLQKRAGGQVGQDQCAAGNGGKGQGQGRGQGQGQARGTSQDATAKLVEMHRGRLQRLEETRAMLAEEGNARGVADMDALIARERSRLSELTAPVAPLPDGGLPQGQK